MIQQRLTKDLHQIWHHFLFMRTFSQHVQSQRRARFEQIVQMLIQPRDRRIIQHLSTTAVQLGLACLLAHTLAILLLEQAVLQRSILMYVLVQILEFVIKTCSERGRRQMIHQRCIRAAACQRGLSQIIRDP